MPRWVKFLLLGTGVLFLIVGVLVGIVGARYMRTQVARLEQLRPLGAVAFADQRVGADAIVEGSISTRNPVIERDVVAYIRDELRVRTDADGDRTQTWREDRRETPPLLIDADGVVTIDNENYSIENAHTTWYDEATLGFDDRPRDGTKRYYGLVVGRPVTAYGTVVQGQEGYELSAKTIFGGTYEEYMVSQREAVAIMPLLGSIFGAVGAILSVIALVFFWRRM